MNHFALVFGVLAVMVTLSLGMKKPPPPKHPHINLDDNHVVMEGTKSHVWMYHKQGAIVMWNHLGVDEGNCPSEGGDSMEMTDGSMQDSSESVTSPGHMGTRQPDSMEEMDDSKEDCKPRRSKITDPITWYIENLAEVSPNGTILQNHKISGDQMTFTINQNNVGNVVTIPNSNVEAKKATMEMSNQEFTLRLVVYIVEKQGNITEGNEVRGVYPGMVKFNVEIDTFPFTNETNKLEVTLKMRARCKSVLKGTRDAGTRGPMKFNICNSAKVVLSDKVIVDGGAPMLLPDEIQILDPVTKNGKHDLDVIKFTFPHFTNNLVYDPETDPGQDEHAADGDGQQMCGGEVCGAMAWTAGLLITVLMAFFSTVINL